MTRQAALDHLYDLLDELETRVGGMRTLDECTGYMDWPDRGVYVFFAPDERRAGTDQRRVTRVGTHAVSTGSETTLWSRLRTHRGAKRGTYEGGGNHRGSVFRQRVGEAMLVRDGIDDQFPQWGVGSSAPRERRLSELPHERRVSEYVRSLPFLWVRVADEPGPESDRAYLERNLIALLSNYDRPACDPRDESWLGRDSRSEKIRESGLWNVDHVEKSYDPSFLDRFAQAVGETTPP